MLFIQDILPGAFGFEGALQYQNIAHVCRAWRLTPEEERVALWMLNRYLTTFREEKAK